MKLVDGTRASLMEDGKKMLLEVMSPQEVLLQVSATESSYIDQRAYLVKFEVARQPAEEFIITLRLTPDNRDYK